MEQKTHKLADRELVGEVVRISEGAAVTRLRTTGKMVVDEKGLVHGAFTFGVADLAAMLAVNKEHAVLAKACVRFLSPVKVGEEVVAEAKVVGSKGRLYDVRVEARVGERRVLEGEMTVVVPERHVLEKIKD